jgi:hypothetical protein
LKSNRASGQPTIEEQQFSTGKIRVTVIWDEWAGLRFEDRTAVILRAYELAEGREYRERIALASGLTVPEAHAAGMLPFEIIPALRRTDAVTSEQCRQAMIEEGASTLVDPNRPQLRFLDLKAAEACRDRLARRLPGSEPVWTVLQEVNRIDIENWPRAESG